MPHFVENLRPKSAPFVPFLPGPAAKAEPPLPAGLPASPGQAPHQQMAMSHQGNLEAAPVVQARALLAAAKRGVEQLEGAATWALCRLAALLGLQDRVELLAGSPEPGEAEAGAMDAATLCRETETLIRSLHARGK
jgi:hypothetical protein